MALFYTLAGFAIAAWAWVYHESWAARGRIFEARVLDKLERTYSSIDTGGGTVHVLLVSLLDATGQQEDSSREVAVPARLWRITGIGDIVTASIQSGKFGGLLVESGFIRAAQLSATVATIMAIVALAISLTL